ncbi:MAG: Sapep family Mn(2+)-dependent dipeptidase [Clostridia bacterium]|nr:Sapep family Mn(2+)-dependent dipeptidase [Clostridia bacterium]
MTQETIARLRDYVASRREEIIRDLFSLVRVPSVKGAPEPGAPQGRPCREALDTALALFEREGLSGEICSDGRYALARRPGGPHTIGVFTHCDVVPVTDDWILTRPFEPVEHDGCLVGRGVHDNKAGVIMALYALAAARDLGLPLGCGVTVFLGASEETGMEDVDAFAAEQPMPDVSLVPDNEYPVCLGEKGICHLWATSDAPLTVVREIAGGVAPNVILDHVTATIAPVPGLLEQLRAAVACDEHCELSATEEQITLTARGVTAHGSMPAGSLNALKVLLRVLTACPALGADRHLLARVRAWLEDDWGAPFGIACDDPEFGPTTATNGVVATADGRLSLSFDVRYGTSLASADVEAALTSAFARAGFRITKMHNSPGFSIPRDEPDAVALIEAYRQLSGDADSPVIYSGGGTYARHLTHAFSCGCEAPYLHRDLDLPQGHGGIHQSDESISVEGLLESIALFTAMLVDLDATYADR